MGRRPVTVRVARWSAEHPWRALALWVVFVAVCFVGGNAAGMKEATAEDMAVGESGRASVMIENGAFGDEPAIDNVLITSRGGALDTAAATAAAKDAAAKLRGVPGVAGVGDPVPAHDGSALLLPITMSGDPETASDRVEPLRAATAQVQTAHPALRVEQVGGPSIGKALDDTLGADFQRAELLSLPVTLAILIIAFGALIAAERAGAAGALVRRRRHRPVHPGLAPRAGQRLDRQRHPAHRHGRRHRLLALLRPAGTGGACQGPRPRRRGRDRGGDVRPRGRRLRYGGRHRDVGPVPRGRRHLLVPRGRLDPRRRRRGDRLPDGPAGAARQARALGGPAPRPAAVAPDRPPLRQRLVLAVRAAPRPALGRCPR
nr:hypothetical protein GCM10020092_041260 [Actinoplanes digitatis]